MNRLLRVRRLVFVVALGGAALILADLGAGVRAQEADAGGTAPAGDAVHGKKIYNEYGCYQCHGYSAQGGRAGPRLAPDPLPYPAFTAYIRRPANQMPPYTEKVVSDKELADIYAFLQTVPEPRDPDDIPLLKKEE